MMHHWTYSQYKNSVNGDIAYAMNTLKFLPAQAIGYAHNELNLRLETYPEENTLALVALGFKVRELVKFDEYPHDDSFVEELLDNVQPPQIESISRALPPNQQADFLEDAAALLQSLRRLKS